MINEMISAVSEAEENAAEIIARAKQNSVDAVELAEKDAEKEILDAINTGRSQLEKRSYFYLGLMSPILLQAHPSQTLKLTNTLLK